MMLQRLTSLEREKIDKEYREVIKDIGRLEDILGKWSELNYVFAAPPDGDAG